MPGPRPMPVALKLLRGNPANDRFGVVSSRRGRLRRRTRRHS